MSRECCSFLSITSESRLLSYVLSVTVAFKCQSRCPLIHCVTPYINKLVAVFSDISDTDVVESLLVVASVGVQLTTTFASGRQTSMFYDIGDISGMVINEAVTMVRHYVVVDS